MRGNYKISNIYKDDEVKKSVGGNADLNLGLSVFSGVKSLFGVK